MTDTKAPKSASHSLVKFAKWFALAAVLIGCDGYASNDDPQSDSSEKNGGEASLDGSEHAPGSDMPIVTESPPPPPKCTEMAAPGPVSLRRLTNSEYFSTMRDLLGGVPDALQQLDFVPDELVYGFDNNAEVQTLSPLHVQKYSDAADDLAEALKNAPQQQRALMGCSLTNSNRNDCLTQFIRRFGRRAYRRPLADDEVAAYMMLANLAASDTDGGVSAIVRGMLQSPYLLFRVERGVPDPSHPGMLKLTGLEVATRLSYLILGSTPDEKLLDLAEAGKLDTADGIEAATRQMFSDGRAREAMRRFYGQWLHLQTLATLERSTTDFPNWSTQLRDAMLQESYLFVDDHIWRSKVNFLDFLTDRYSFVNGLLASFYGLHAPAMDWNRVEYPEGAPRAGFITQGSFLTVTSQTNTTSATRRGKYIREVLLCEVMPPPPPNVMAVLPAVMEGETELQRFARHTTDPFCAGCHTRMDPIGFGLQQYDAIGLFRRMDASGHPIDGKGTIAGFTPPDFTGAIELGNKVHNAEQTPTCVVTQLFRYALGRGEEAADSCSIQSMAQAFKASGYSFRTTLLALVRSDAFRYRAATSAAAPGGM